MLEETQGIKIDLKTLDQIAHADLDRNKKAIDEAARAIDPKKSPAEVVAQVLSDRPPPADVLALAETQATELRAFLIDHHIVSVPGTDVTNNKKTPPNTHKNTATHTNNKPFETK